jgi:hypothetical protein
MKDPRMNRIAESGEPMPFDMKRMSYGGFTAIVDRRRAAPIRRLEARVAHDAGEHHRRPAGNVDHVMVGHFVGFAANAGIGVATQIWIVIIVFITSLFTGMSVLVSRFAGAGDEAKWTAPSTRP